MKRGRLLLHTKGFLMVTAVFGSICLGIRNVIEGNLTVWLGNEDNSCLPTHELDISISDDDDDDYVCGKLEFVSRDSVSVIETQSEGPKTSLRICLYQTYNNTS
ncbi:hypothetical protein GW17_00030744 [Ensete ventricosum]|nr:hypothetical protein GW17_00030744 [Ensete ventricosum]